MKHWLTRTLVPPLGYSLIRMLGKTMCWSTDGSALVDQFYHEGKRMIIAFWHDQQLMMPLAYRGNGAHILISQHRDGELICRIVKRFGFGAVRGSTTRGGSMALRQLIRLGQSGSDLVVTPDGPKGPRHRVQKGVIGLAQATGLPIIPLTFACSKKNSSQVGTSSSFPCLFPRRILFGGNLSGLRGLLMNSFWNKDVRNWNRYYVPC